MDIRFCYKIAAEAEVAHDTETGEPTSAYLQIRLGEVEDYAAKHEQLRTSAARLLQISPEHITPISQEQYDEEADDE